MAISIHSVPILKKCLALLPKTDGSFCGKNAGAEKTGLLFLPHGYGAVLLPNPVIGKIGRNDYDRHVLPGQGSSAG